MLRARTSETSAVSIEGDRRGFETLAQLLHVGSGHISLAQVGDPSPYNRWLSAIVAVHTDSERVWYSIEKDELVIAYPAALADKLAWNLGEFMLDGVEGGSHRHEEFFPGHFYLDPSSEPLVLEYLADVGSHRRDKWPFARRKR